VNYIAKLLGTCRFVYNNLLAHRISAYNERKESVPFGELGKQLVALKVEQPWIREVHSKVLQQSMINLEAAYKSFFKNGMGFPKFKSKHDPRSSCRFPADAFMGVRGNRLSLVKALSDIHFKCSVRDERYLNRNQDKVRSATLSKTKAGQYHLSILIDGDFASKEVKPKMDVVGIDLGISTFVTTSLGKTYENLKVIRSNELRLKRLHQQLSRKQKGSKNKDKARIRLARMHDKLNNQKEYYLHAVSNSLLDESQVVAMEDLNVKGMMQNGRLARGLQELSLHRFKSMLEYKAAWRGRDLIQVDRFFPSSKLCSACGEKNDGLKLEHRQWRCACGALHERDLNAAKNIEREGRRLLGIGCNNNTRSFVEGGTKGQIGPSSPEFKPLERPTRDAMKKEKNVAHGGKR